MTLSVLNFRTQHVRIETSPGSGVYASIATINTSRGIKFTSSGADVYVPDPNNPEIPLPRAHRVTQLSATISGAGTFPANDSGYLTTWWKSGDSKNVQFWQETNGYWPMAVKLTEFGGDSEPPKGDDATATLTLESDGVIGDYVDMTGTQTYSSLARALSTGANETLDVNGGGLLDILGAAVAFTVVESVEIRAAAANTTTLTVGAATYPFAGLTGVLAAGQSMRCDGTFAISAGVNDQIKVTNGSGATAHYDIVIIGHA